SQEVYVSAALPQTKRVMVKDEDVCLHCGLCAERCPTAAWDMRKFDLLVPYAGQEGQGARGSGLGSPPMPRALAPSP
ncbi:MAG TPA: 4Fe-4S binding protein, partial [Gemmatimonadaceae bacterium]|nr:4Fe-4S binding protein [Gemmatimonadaceae bacterium]